MSSRLFSSPWEGESALVLMLTGVGSTGSGDERQKTFESALRHAKAAGTVTNDLLQRLLSSALQPVQAWATVIP